MIIDNVYVYTADKIFVKGGIVLVGGCSEADRECD